MKVKKATFEFRGWKFEFTPAGSRESHGRIYTIWNITGWHHNQRKGPVYKGGYLAFVPSACICRRIIKWHFRKPISAKRKKQLIENLI